MTLKSAEFAAKHNIADKMEVDTKAGLISFGEDFYAGTLESIGLELGQVQKLQKHNSALLSGTTLVAGEKAAEMFKKDPNLSEVSFTYHVGHDRAHGFFNRAAEGVHAGARNVVDTHGMDRGEMSKVHKHIKALFDDINN